MTFCLSELSYAAPFEPSANAALKPIELIAREPGRFEAPLDFARLKEIHQGSADKLIIQIQDAHSNLSGQENLAGALDQIMSRYGVSLVLSEGGADDCSLTELKKIAPASVWKKIAKSYLIQGKLSGEEYLNLTSDHPMKIMGLEDLGLYLKSLRAYADLADRREAILDYLKTIRAALEKLKRRYYPKELLSYEAERRTSEKDKSNYLPLLALAQSKNIDLSVYPMVERLVELTLKEKLVDFDAASLEQAALIDELDQKGGAEDVRRALAKMDKSRDSRIAQLSFFENTLSLAEKKNISLAKYPHWTAYGDYLKAFAAIDLDDLLGQMERAEDAVYKSVIASEAKQSHHDKEIASSPSAPRNDENVHDALLIRALDRYFALLETAYRIQMSTSEFETFEANVPDFGTPADLAFMNRRLMEAGYFDDVIAYRDILEKGKKALEAFYSSVRERDLAFVKNAEKYLAEDHQNVAVLISGGYHTPHLKKLFAEKGWSMAVLQPIVTSETNQKKYESLLLAPVRPERQKIEVIDGESKKDKPSALEKDFLQAKTKDGIRVALDNPQQALDEAIQTGSMSQDKRALFETKLKILEDILTQAKGQEGVNEAAAGKILNRLSQEEKSLKADHEPMHSMAAARLAGAKPAAAQSTRRDFLRQGALAAVAVLGLGQREAVEAKPPQKKAKAVRQKAKVVKEEEKESYELGEDVLQDIAAERYDGKDQFGNRWKALRFEFPSTPLHLKRGEQYIIEYDFEDGSNWGIQPVPAGQKPEDFTGVFLQMGVPTGEQQSIILTSAVDVDLSHLVFQYGNYALSSPLNPDDSATLTIRSMKKILSKKPAARKKSSRREKAGARLAANVASADSQAALLKEFSNYTGVVYYPFALDDFFSLLDLIRTFPKAKIVLNDKLDRAHTERIPVNIEDEKALLSKLFYDTPRNEARWRRESLIKPPQVRETGGTVDGGKIYRIDFEMKEDLPPDFRWTDRQGRPLPKKFEIEYRRSDFFQDAGISAGVIYFERPGWRGQLLSQDGGEKVLSRAEALLASPGYVLMAHDQGYVIGDEYDKNVAGTLTRKFRAVDVPSRPAFFDHKPISISNRYVSVFQKYSDSTEEQPPVFFFAKPSGARLAHQPKPEKIVELFSQDGVDVDQRRVVSAYLTWLRLHDRLRQAPPSPQDIMQEALIRSRAVFDRTKALADRRLIENGYPRLVVLDGSLEKDSVVLAIYRTLINSEPLSLASLEAAVPDVSRERLENALADRAYKPYWGLLSEWLAWRTQLPLRFRNSFDRMVRELRKEALQIRYHDKVRRQKEAAEKERAELLRKAQEYLSTFLIDDGAGTYDTVPAFSAAALEWIRSDGVAFDGVDAPRLLAYVRDSMGLTYKDLAVDWAYWRAFIQKRRQAPTLEEIRSLLNGNTNSRDIAASLQKLRALPEVSPDAFAVAGAGARLAMDTALDGQMQQVFQQLPAALDRGKKFDLESPENQPLLVDRIQSLRDSAQEVLDEYYGTAKQQQFLRSLIGQADKFLAEHSGARLAASSEPPKPFVHNLDQIKIDFDFPQVLKDAGEGKEGAIETLGFAYASLTPAQKKSVYPLLHKKAGEGNKTALEALGVAYASLTQTQRKSVYPLLIDKTKENGALSTLGWVYDALTQAQKEAVYPLLYQGAQKGSGTALAALGIAYASFTQTQKESVYLLLIDKTKSSGYALWALGEAYGSLTQTQKESVYPFLFEKAYQKNEGTALRALGAAYAFLTPDQKESVYRLLCNQSISATLSMPAVYGLAHAYSFLPVDQQKAIYPTIKKYSGMLSFILRKASTAGAPQAKEPPQTIFNPGQIKAPAAAPPAISNADEIREAFNKEYPNWLSGTEQGEPGHLKLMGEAYAAMTPKQKQSILKHVIFWAVKGPGERKESALFALGLMYGALAPAPRDKAYPLIKKNVRALGPAFAYLDEIPRQKAYALLYKKAVEDGDPNAAEALAQAHAFIPSGLREEIGSFFLNSVYVGKDLNHGFDFRYLNALAICYDSLSAEQKLDFKKILKSNSELLKSDDADVIYGKLYHALDEGEKKARYDAIYAKAKKGGHGQSLDALIDAYDSLTPGQQKQVFELVKNDEYLMAGLFGKLGSQSASAPKAPSPKKKQPKIAKPAISNPDEIRKAFDGAFPKIIEEIENDNAFGVIDALFACLGSAYVSMDEHQKQIVYPLLLKTATSEHVNNKLAALAGLGAMYGSLMPDQKKTVYPLIKGHIEALGYAFAYFDPEQKKEAFAFLFGKAGEDFSAQQSLGRCYAFLDTDQQQKVYDLLLKKSEEKSGKSFSLPLAMAYSALDEEKRQFVHSLINDKTPAHVLSEAFGALSAAEKKTASDKWLAKAKKGDDFGHLINAYSWLTPDQQNEAFQLVKNDNMHLLELLGKLGGPVAAPKPFIHNPAQILNDLKFHESAIRKDVDLGIIFPLIENSEKGKVYEDLMNLAEAGSWDANEALGYVYPFVNPSEQAKIYALLLEIKKPSALISLGLMYRYLDNEGEKLKVYSLLREEMAIGEEDRLMSVSAMEGLGHVFDSLEPEQRQDTLEAFWRNVLSSTEVSQRLAALKALALAYGTLDEAQRESAYEYLIAQAEKGGVIVEALGYIYRDLTPQQKAKVYPLMNDGTHFGLLARARAYEWLGEARQKESYPQVVGNPSALAVVARKLITSPSLSSTETTASAALPAAAPKAAKPSISNPDEIREAFYQKYPDIIEDLQVGDSIQSIGEAFVSLDKTQQELVFDRIYDWATSDYADETKALFAMGQMYGAMTPAQRQEAYPLIKEDVRALGPAFAYLDEIQRQKAYSLVYEKAVEGSDFAAAAALAQIHPFLPSALQNEVGDFFLNKVIVNNDTGYLIPLAICFDHLSPSQKLHFEKRLPSDPKEMPYGLFGKAYRLLNNKQKKNNFYSAFYTQAEKGNVDALSALVEAYDALVPDQQKQVFKLVKDKGDVLMLAVLFGKLGGLAAPSTAGHEASAAPSIQAPSLAIDLGQVKSDFNFSAVLAKAKQGDTFALEALGRAYAALDSEQQTAAYGVLFHDAFVNYTAASMKALGRIYPALNPVKKQAVFNYLLNNKNFPSALEALGLMLGHLESRDEIYSLLIKGADTDFFAVEALGFAYEFLTPVQKDEVYNRFLGMTDEKDVPASMGRIYCALTEAQRKESGIYPYLLERATAGEGNALIGLGVIYGTLSPMQKEAIYLILSEAAKKKDGAAVLALAHALPYLEPARQKEFYAKIKKQSLPLSIVLEQAAKGKAAVAAPSPQSVAPTDETTKPSPTAKPHDVIYNADQILEAFYKAYPNIIKAVEAGSTGELLKLIEMLGEAYPSLNPNGKEKVYSLLLERATQMGGSVKGAAMLGLAHAYGALTPDERQVVYPLLKESPSCLGFVYPYLDPQQKKDAFSVLSNLAEQGNEYAIESLGRSYAFFDTERKAHVYQWLNLDFTLFPVFTARALAIAYESMGPAERAEVYPYLLKFGEVELSYAYRALSPETQESVYTHFVSAAALEKNNELSLEALVRIYGSLKHAQQEKVFNLVKGNDALLMKLFGKLSPQPEPAQPTQVPPAAPQVFNADVPEPTTSMESFFDKMSGGAFFGEESKSKQAHLALPQLAGSDYFQPGRTPALEIDYASGKLMRVNYDFPTGSFKNAAPDPLAQKIVKLYKRFEELNSEVLVMLGKPDKSPQELLDLLDKMQEMTLAYLILFKGQAPDKTLQTISMSDSDLQGGRSIAKLYLSIRRALEDAMKELRCEPGQTSIINDRIESLIQRFGADRSGHYVERPAESYENEVRGLTLRDPLDWNESRGTVSFAEFINIVHQKGIRNLAAIAPSEGSQKSYVTKVGREGAGPVALSVTLHYLDGRSRLDEAQPPILRAIAQAFSKGQLVHKNYRFFDPSSAKIMIGDDFAVIGLKLGAHSAAIQFSLGPVQENGRILVSYTDSGSKYFPGSSIRLMGLTHAFKDAGFFASQDGSHMEAVYDKDHGPASISELPDKLNFAIQAVTSTLDLDLAFNEIPDARSNMADFILRLNLELAKNGFLVRSSKEDTYGSTRTSRQYGSLIQAAEALGIMPSAHPDGQLRLDQVSNSLFQMLARGELIADASGTITHNDAYRETESRGPPIEALINRIWGAGQTRLRPMRQIAGVAQAVQSFGSRNLIGFIGDDSIEELKLPVLGDVITFYLLKSNETGRYELGMAFLGEFPFGEARYDIFREKRLEHGNALNFDDLRQLLEPQGFASTVETRLWLRSLGASNENIFAALRNSKFLDAAVPPFSKESLLKSAAGGQNISSLSIGGTPLRIGKALGIARFNRAGRNPLDFKNGILIAESTTNQDDPSLAQASGIVVTTGGVTSHAAVRSRENKKPSAILNGAQIDEAGFHFRAHSGTLQEKNITVGGQAIRYFSTTGGTLADHVIREGDLVYLDGGSGMLYFIAAAGDSEGKTAKSFRAYEEWKTRAKTFPINAGAEVKALERILAGASNDNLFRAMLDEIISRNFFTPEALDRLLTDVSKKPGKKQVVSAFLRQQTEALVESFNREAAAFHRYAAQAGGSRHEVEQVYLMADRLFAHARQLDQMIQAANGDWQQPLDRPALQALMEEIRLRANEWLSRARSEAAALAVDLASDLNKAELALLSGAWDLFQLLDLSAHSSNPFLPAVVEAIGLRIEALTSERLAESAAMEGRGIVWKNDLKDRFSRNIAGGKGSNSAETVRALETLRQKGLLDPSIEVVTPAGFAIQPTEYFLWRAREGSKDALEDPILVKNIAVGYRDLVLKQVDALKLLVDSDARTTGEFKDDLRRILFDRAKVLPRLEDPHAISVLIDAMRDLVRFLMERHEFSQVSQSLKNRLEVFGAVAVRSSGLKEDSAEEAMAGMKETKLNVSGVDGLLEALADVWASGAEAVLVDEMINSKVSGVAFSADPASLRTDRIRVDAAHGQAKGLVDQQVKDPDSFVLEKKNGSGYEVVSSHIGKKAEKVVLNFDAGGGYQLVPNDRGGETSLDGKQLHAVADTVHRLSEYLGRQIDMEWTFDADNRLVILQQRPITTIGEAVLRGKNLLNPDNGPASAGARLAAKVTSYSIAGPDHHRRQVPNQDAHVAVRINLPGVAMGSGQLFAIFDAHGERSEAYSQFAANDIQFFFEASLRHGGTGVEVMERAASVLRGALDYEQTKNRLPYSVGSMIALVYLTDSDAAGVSEAIYYSVGDSIIAMRSADGTFSVVPTHNNSEPAERKRILDEAARQGEQIIVHPNELEIKGIGRFQHSRAFGNPHLKPYITDTPEVGAWKLHAGDSLILTSDGIPLDKVKRVLRNQDEAIDLVKASDKDDDKTAIVVRVQGARLADPMMVAALAVPALALVLVMSHYADLWSTAYRANRAAVHFAEAENLLARNGWETEERYSAPEDIRAGLLGLEFSLRRFAGDLFANRLTDREKRNAVRKISIQSAALERTLAPLDLGADLGFDVDKGFRDFLGRIGVLPKSKDAFERNIAAGREIVGSLYEKIIGEALLPSGARLAGLIPSDLQRASELHDSAQRPPVKSIFNLYGEADRAAVSRIVYPAAGDYNEAWTKALLSAFPGVKEVYLVDPKYASDSTRVLQAEGHDVIVRQVAQRFENYALAANENGSTAFINKNPQYGLLQDTDYLTSFAKAVKPGDWVLSWTHLAPAVNQPLRDRLNVADEKQAKLPTVEFRDLPWTVWRIGGARLAAENNPEDGTTRISTSSLSSSPNVELKPEQWGSQKPVRPISLRQFEKFDLFKEGTLNDVFKARKIGTEDYYFIKIPRYNPKFIPLLRRERNFMYELASVMEPRVAEVAGDGVIDRAEFDYLRASVADPADLRLEREFSLLRELMQAARRYNQSVPYLVTKDAGGMDVADRIKGFLKTKSKNGQAELEKEVYREVEAVASAVFYLNEHGIFHRDLKPQEIILGPQTRIIDFGIAAFIPPAGAVRPSGDFDLSVDELTRLGAQNYASTYSGNSPDPARRDLHAVEKIIDDYVDVLPNATLKTELIKMASADSLEKIVKRLAEIAPAYTAASSSGARLAATLTGRADFSYHTAWASKVKGTVIVRPEYKGALLKVFAQINPRAVGPELLERHIHLPAQMSPEIAAERIANEISHVRKIGREAIGQVLDQALKPIDFAERNFNAIRNSSGDAFDFRVIVTKDLIDELPVNVMIDFSDHLPWQVSEEFRSEPTPLFNDVDNTESFIFPRNMSADEIAEFFQRIIERDGSISTSNLIAQVEKTYPQGARLAPNPIAPEELHFSRYAQLSEDERLHPALQGLIREFFRVWYGPRETKAMRKDALEASADWMHETDRGAVIAFYGGKPIGIYQFKPTSFPFVARGAGIFIRPDYQGRRAGMQLYEATLRSLYQNRFDKLSVGETSFYRYGEIWQTKNAQRLQQRFLESYPDDVIERRHYKGRILGLVIDIRSFVRHAQTGRTVSSASASAGSSGARLAVASDSDTIKAAVRAAIQEDIRWLILQGRLPAFDPDIVSLQNGRHFDAGGALVFRIANWPESKDAKLKPQVYIYRRYADKKLFQKELRLIQVMNAGQRHYAAEVEPVPADSDDLADGILVRQEEGLDMLKLFWKAYDSKEDDLMEMIIVTQIKHVATLLAAGFYVQDPLMSNFILAERTSVESAGGQEMYVLLHDVDAQFVQKFDETTADIKPLHVLAYACYLLRPLIDMTVKKQVGADEIRQKFHDALEHSGMGLFADMTKDGAAWQQAARLLRRWEGYPAAERLSADKLDETFREIQNYVPSFSPKAFRDMAVNLKASTLKKNGRIFRSTRFEGFIYETAEGPSVMIDDRSGKGARPAGGEAPVSGARMAAESAAGSAPIFKTLFDAPFAEPLASAAEAEDSRMTGLLAQYFIHLRRADALKTGIIPARFESGVAGARFAADGDKIRLDLYKLGSEGDETLLGSIDLTKEIAAYESANPVPASAMAEIAETAKPLIETAHRFADLNQQALASAQSLGALDGAPVLFKVIVKGDPSQGLRKLMLGSRDYIKERARNVRFEFYNENGARLAEYSDDLSGFQGAKTIYYSSYEENNAARESLLNRAESEKAGVLFWSAADVGSVFPYTTDFMLGLITARTRYENLSDVDKNLFNQRFGADETRGPLDARQYNAIRLVTNAAFPYQNLLLVPIGRFAKDAMLEAARLALQAIGAAA